MSGPDPESGDIHDTMDIGSRTADEVGGAGGGVHRVKIALSLYKVQQNIYLLDFQRVEVRVREY